MRTLALILMVCFSGVENIPIPPSNNPLNVAQCAWLSGRWTGTGLGGFNEEIWSPASEGVMMGVYRHMNDNKVIFYELMTIDYTGLKLKHFNADLTGWEEKADHVFFPAISYSENRLEFEGLVYEKTDGDNIRVTLQLQEDGKVRTEEFYLQRQ